MRVLHTIPRLKLTAGGPPLSTSLTVTGLRDEHIDAEILSYALASSKDRNIIEGDFVHFAPSPREKIIAYSPYLLAVLKKLEPYDIYHCQGVWQYPSFATASFARKIDKPYIITPRGMLYPQLFKNNALAKKIMWSFRLKSDLQKANCIHVTCMEEMEHLRNMGIKAPMAVIPNPLDTEVMETGLMNKQDKKFRIGYLGRIDPRKHIDRLIHVWAKLGSLVEDGELIIIGGGNDEHQSYLEKEVKRLNLSNVRFTGFLIGREKVEALCSLSYLVVPSDFENFGMIIAEALMHKVPVMASKGTPWQELEEYHCGWWIDNDENSIEAYVKKALFVSEEERVKMGRNGQALIKRNYSKVIIAKKMKLLYEWVLHRGVKPNFVYVD